MTADSHRTKKETEAELPTLPPRTTAHPGPQHTLLGAVHPGPRHTLLGAVHPGPQHTLLGAVHPGQGTHCWVPSTQDHGTHCWVLSEQMVCRCPCSGLSSTWIQKVLREHATEL